MTSEEYGQYIDDFELGADVMPGESLTEYIERRRREFESKADGGSIGIEVLFGPKREKFNMGGGQFTSGGNISPGTDRRGNVRDDNPFTGGGGGGNTIKVAELTPKQKKFINQQKFGLQENLIPARDIFNKITNPNLNIFDTGTFGFGGQEPTTEEEFNEYLKSIGVVQQVKDGGRVGLFMGGPALEGQALQIYNSMKGYNFSDQEIADALSARGLYTASGSGTATETTQPNIIGAELNQSGGGGGGSFPIGSIYQTSAPASGYMMSTFNEEFAPSGEVNLIPGKTNFTGTGLIGDFMAANEARNRKLVKPGKIASFAYDKGFPKQRSVQEMIESGQTDTRRSAGLPFGISGLVAKALPDRYFDMSLEDQVFTQSQMGYDGPTIFGENTMGNKDPFGINVRSAFGNYAEYVTNRVAELEESLENAQKKYGGLTDQYFNMTKNLRKELGFRKAQEQLKQEQAKQIEEARKKKQKEIQEAATKRTYSLQDLQDSSDRGTGQSYAAARARTASRFDSDTGKTKAYGLKDGGLATMFTRRR